MLNELLPLIHSGDRAALDAAIPLLYSDLKRLAARHLRREVSPLIEPGDLVHETYLKLYALRHPNYQSRAHFLAIASNLMRQILVDRARFRLAAKRAGVQTTLTTVEEMGQAPSAGGLQMVIDDALLRLSVSQARIVRLIKMRLFAGMTAEESAEVLGISVNIARKDIRLGYAWLRRELSAAAAA